MDKVWSLGERSRYLIRVEIWETKMGNFAAKNPKSAEKEKGIGRQSAAGT